MTKPLSSSSNSKKAYDQSPGKSRGKLGKEESPGSGWASTPPAKGKQPSHESRAVSGRPDPPLMSSPTPPRKVVPIKLDRGPRQSEQQTQNAAAGGEAQVWFELDCRQQHTIWFSCAQHADPLATDDNANCAISLWLRLA